jgi:hypothetical protein
VVASIDVNAATAAVSAFSVVSVKRRDIKPFSAKVSSSSSVHPPSGPIHSAHVDVSDTECACTRKLATIFVIALVF